MSFNAFVSFLVWGFENIGASADTRLLTLGFSRGTAENDATANDSEGAFLAPRAGTIRNLRARHNTNNGSTPPPVTTVQYTLFVNGVATALTATVIMTPAVGDSASDLVNEVTVAPGDIIEMKAIKAAGIGSGQLKPQVTVEFI